MPDEIKTDVVWYSLLNHNVLIVWKPEYKLGIPIIDEQHRGIVSTINSLHYAMEHGHGESVLQPVIDMVEDYTRIHFALEENFLERCKFPDVEHHRKLHKELSHSLFKVGKESLWESDPHQFMEFLKKWWIDHICNKDQVFRDYLLKILDASHNNS